MPEFTMTLLFQLGCFFPFLLLCWAVYRTANYRYIVLALALMVTDLMAAMLTKKIPGLHFEGQSWNWFGKGAQILVALLIFMLFPKVRLKVWSRWKQSSKAIKQIVITLSALTLGGLFIGFMNPPEAFDIETFLFQIFMPSLSEEFMYRGVLFFLFLNAFKGSKKSGYGDIISAFLVTVWFGILHGISYSNGAIQIDWISTLVTGIVGGLLITLRMNSGNLVFPVVGHSIYNLCIQLVAVLRY